MNSIEILRQWQTWAKQPCIASTRDFIQRGVFAWESGMIADFPMVRIHKPDQKIIGAVGYNDRSRPSEGLYEIGYWCDIDYQGHGLVTESANTLTRYAFDTLQARNVVISMQTGNEKSIAVAKRLSFTRTGTKDRDPVYIDEEKNRVVRSVNSGMVQAYWLIGRDIVEAEQERKGRAAMAPIYCGLCPGI